MPVEPNQTTLLVRDIPYQSNDSALVSFSIRGSLATAPITSISHILTRIEFSCKLPADHIKSEMEQVSTVSIIKSLHLSY